MRLESTALALVPSTTQLTMLGPFRPSSAASEGMQRQGRMNAVTLEGLLDAGYIEMHTS